MNYLSIEKMAILRVVADVLAVGEDIKVARTSMMLIATTLGTNMTDNIEASKLDIFEAFKILKKMDFEKKKGVKSYLEMAAAVDGSSTDKKGNQMKAIMLQIN